VVKVRLSNFERVDSLTLEDGENELFSAVIDPAGKFAYFGSVTNPGLVVSVRLSDFTRAGSLTLNDGENKLRSAVMDPSGGYAYFGTYTTLGMIVRIAFNPLGLPVVYR
jgi:hypothetical protein